MSVHVRGTLRSPDARAFQQPSTGFFTIYEQTFLYLFVLPNLRRSGIIGNGGCLPNAGMDHFARDVERNFCGGRAAGGEGAAAGVGLPSYSGPVADLRQAGTGA